MALIALSRRAPVALGALALTLASSSPASAGLRETYNQALSAVEETRWKDAESLLRQSIAMRPAEARRLPFKGIMRPYFPHFYLGVALGRQGDCRGALEELRTSESQQAIVGHELHDYLLNSRATCAERLTGLERLVSAGGAALDQATAAADEMAESGRNQVLGFGYEGGSMTLGQRLATARSDIAEVRIDLERADAEQSHELAETTLERAKTIGSELEQALATADRLVEQLAAAHVQKRDRMDDVRDLAARVGSLLRTRSPLPPALRGIRQQLESLLAGAAALPETATLAQVEALSQRLLTFERRLQGTESPPPGALRSGAIAFLRGDYPAVLERLEEIPYRDDKARGHCLLLRSAAAYSLYVASGETDRDLLAKAEADASAAKETLPDLTPAEVAFSPRFVRFYESAEPASDTLVPESLNGQERTR